MYSVVCCAQVVRRTENNGSNPQRWLIPDGDGDGEAEVTDWSSSNTVLHEPTGKPQTHSSLYSTVLDRGNGTSFQ